jgi:hypothetical protein
MTTKRMGQMDSNTRGAITANTLHGMVESAAGSGSASQTAMLPMQARENLNVVQYGTGMALDNNAASARASSNTQGAIQANMNNPAAAATIGANAAYAASFPSSHTWCARAPRGRCDLHAMPAAWLAPAPPRRMQRAPHATAPTGQAHSLLPHTLPSSLAGTTRPFVPSAAATRRPLTQPPKTTRTLP